MIEPTGRDVDDSSPGPFEYHWLPEVPEITAIRYERVVNLGNYESVRLTAETVINAGDNVDDIYERMKAWVDRRLQTVRAEGKI